MKRIQLAGWSLVVALASTTFASVLVLRPADTHALCSASAEKFNAQVTAAYVLAKERGAILQPPLTLLLKKSECLSRTRCECDTVASKCSIDPNNLCKGFDSTCFCGKKRRCKDNDDCRASCVPVPPAQPPPTSSGS